MLKLRKYINLIDWSISGNVDVDAVAHAQRGHAEQDEDESNGVLKDETFLGEIFQSELQIKINK